MFPHCQVSYDNVESMGIKAQWVNSLGLGGAMVSIGYRQCMLSSL